MSEFFIRHSRCGTAEASLIQEGFPPEAILYGTHEQPGIACRLQTLTGNHKP